MRTSGFATVRPDGTRRLYALDPAPLGEVEDWAAEVRRFWEQRLDALGTELARGVRERRRRVAPGAGAHDPVSRAAGGDRTSSGTDAKHDTDTDTDIDTWRAS